MGQVFSEILVGRATFAEGFGDSGEGRAASDYAAAPMRDPIATSWLMSSAISDAGLNITPDTAMAAAAVFACVNVIASTLAALPIRVYRKDDCEALDDHPISRLLNTSPNPDSTAPAFREAYAVGLLLWGNGFAWVERDGIDPAALWLLPSRSTTPARYPGQKQLWYRTVVGGQTYDGLDPSLILHTPDISFDGIVGLSRVRYASNPIGLELAMEKYASKFFANGANAGGFIELPPTMKPEQVNAFIASWKKNYVGLENSLKTGLLTDGMKFNRTMVDPRQSQMIDTRIFQVREVARIYGVPLHKIGDLDRATFSNIEQQNIEFKENCLGPISNKIDKELSRKLLTTAEQGKLEIRHDFDGLLRSDTTARYGAYNIALQGGWMTRNEIRRKEGLPPIPGGDTALQPLNMGPANGKQESPPTATPPNSDKEEQEEEDDEDKE